MSKHRPKSLDTNNPPSDKVSNQGRINTQGKEGGVLRNDKSKTDQSEGAKGGGQPTNFHGQGAGFSRNLKHDMH